VDGVVYWLELVVGDMWTVWYTGWNRPNSFNTQYFNYYPFLTYIYITYTTPTEIIIIFNCHVVTVTQLIVM